VPGRANHRASLAVLAGLLAVLAIPAGIALAQQSGKVRLLDVAFAIPVAVLLGIAAVAFARGARARLEWTVGRAGGAARARVGRLLGGLGICLAITASISVGVYELLIYLEQR
jgi:hypothetical protein